VFQGLELANLITNLAIMRKSFSAVILNSTPNIEMNGVNLENQERLLYGNDDEVTNTFKMKTKSI
jgi:hypothetical protein